HRDEDGDAPALEPVEPVHVVEDEDEGDDGGGLRRDREPFEVVLLLGEADVVPGEADGPAYGRQRREHAAEQAEPVEPELVEEERRRDAERDDVRERVELDAEVTDAVHEAGHHPVHRVEEPGGDDEPGGLVEVALCRHDDGVEAAEEVEQGEGGRERRTRDAAPAGMPPRPVADRGRGRLHHATPSRSSPVPANASTGTCPMTVSPPATRSPIPTANSTSSGTITSIREPNFTMP